MKKSNLNTLLITLITSLFIVSGSAFADDTWNGTDKTGNAWRTGKVGIGTTTPNTKLHVNSGNLNTALTLESEDPIVLFNMKDIATTGSGWAFSRAGDNLVFYTSDSDRMIIDSDGNVGIGTSTPSHKLDIFTGRANVKTYTYGLETTVNTTGGWARAMRFRNENDNAVSAFGSLHGEAYIAAGFDINTDPIGYMSPQLFIKSNGNVGIGTTTPDYKLDVKGTIRAEEVKVETGWSDFVFENDYALPALNQVESYIKENKHLPDIPSAKEVEKEGLSMAEMMTKQMQKIEELTLYVIEQNKRIESLEKELSKRNSN